MNNSDSKIPKNIILAKWSDRFFAWLIDFIIISSISMAIIFTLFGTLYYELEENGFWAESIQYVPTSIFFFVYWTILEYKTGQTIGKKILNLKITDIQGSNPSLKVIIISSIGKSFLLPIDVILGWILTNDKRQRIFNRLGDTIVIKIKESENTQNIKFVKD